VNCSELIHDKEVIIFVLEPDAPLSLDLKYAIVAPEITLSRVDLHDAAGSLALDHVVEEVPFVLNHGNVLELRQIVV
jgi:hypothetical protein